MNTFFTSFHKPLFVMGIVSLAINVVLIVSAFVSGKRYLAVPPIENDGEPYLTTACMVSFPLPEYDGPSFSLGLMSLALRQGDTVYLQFSTLENERQSNKAFQYRCDRDVVEVRSDNDRTVIKALSSGETMLEALTPDGVIPVCLVTVKQHE